MTSKMNVDQSVAFYVNQLGGLSKWIDPTVVFVAHYIPYLLAAVFLLAVYRLAEGKKERLWFLFEGALAVFLSRAVVVEIIRFFFHRPRPYLEDPAIVALLNETSYSFPSGHAAFFFALSTTVFLHNKRWGVFFYIVSAFIGFARMMAGVHYLTDILGGAVLGFAIGWVVHTYFVKKHHHPSVPSLERRGG